MVIDRPQANRFITTYMAFLGTLVTADEKRGKRQEWRNRRLVDIRQLAAKAARVGVCLRIAHADPVAYSSASFVLTPVA